MEAPAVETVLVGVDGSAESMDAAELGVTLAERYGADLIALYILDREDVAALEAGTTSPDDISDTTRAFISDLERLAETQGVTMRSATAYGFSTSQKTVHPGSVVLDAVEDFGADFVVLPREPLGGTPPQAGTLAKAAEYALLYASQPILAV